MKVLDILVEKPDGSMEIKTEFTAIELQTFLQFAINMSASIGLGVAKAHADTLFEKLKAHEDRSNS